MTHDAALDASREGGINVKEIARGGKRGLRPPSACVTIGVMSTFDCPALRGMLLPAALLACWACLPAGAAAQTGDRGPAPPGDYIAALGALEAGDTAAALTRLRQAVRDEPRFGPAHLRLGSILSARAGEAEQQFRDRQEARQQLERAFALMGDDPEVLLEYGLLLRKQQMRTDARRVLERAWAATERQGRMLAPRDAARLHLAMARIYETWWEDWENLVGIPPTAQGGWSCAALTSGLVGPVAQTYGDFAVFCPAQWWGTQGQLTPIADLKSEERDRLLGHLWTAFTFDPSLTDAAVRLLGHLADGAEWERYDSVAGVLVEAAPGDPHAHLFRGLGLHERGFGPEAEETFRAGLALLQPEERAVYEDITLLLRRRVREGYEAYDEEGRAEAARVFFTGADPLFLDPTEGRRLEHYARVAWAELKFGAPASGFHGWETERGEIWIRYGRPVASYQCCYGAGARHVYWSYGEEGPNFAFRRPLTYRRARLTEPGKMLADELAAEHPEAYAPRTLPAVYAFPHQLARFRGTTPDLVRLEIHGRLPADALEVAPGDSIETGLFLFDTSYRPLWERRSRAAVGDRPLALSYRGLELPSGEILYGLEARRIDDDTVARPAARHRSAVELVPFAPGRLSASDILLADTIAARGVEAPRSRDDLFLLASRSTEVEQGQPVRLYFEVYGLILEDGFGSYRAELAVEDSTRRNVVRRLLRAGAEVLGAGDPETRVRWERQVEVVDDVVPEYLTVELGVLDPGDYAIRIRIRDLATGQDTETVRRLTVVRHPAL